MDVSLHQQEITTATLGRLRSFLPSSVMVPANLQIRDEAGGKGVGNVQ